MENLMDAYPTQSFEVAYALQELGKKESWPDALAPLRTTGALWDDIRAAALNDEGAEQAADDADTTVVPRFLQVSAKLAWPFVRGTSYAESLEWFDKVEAAAPTTGGGAVDAGIVAMETFFRAAATVDDVGEPLIEAPWRAQAMDAEATLRWHSECAGSFAPRAVPPLVEAGPRLDGQLPANTVRRMDERVPPGAARKSGLMTRSWSPSGLPASDMRGSSSSRSWLL